MSKTRVITRAAYITPACLAKKAPPPRELTDSGRGAARGLAGHWDDRRRPLSGPRGCCCPPRLWPGRTVDMPIAVALPVPPCRDNGRPAGARLSRGCRPPGRRSSLRDPEARRHVAARDRRGDFADRPVEASAQGCVRFFRPGTDRSGAATASAGLLFRRTAAAAPYRQGRAGSSWPVAAPAGTPFTRPAAGPPPRRLRPRHRLPS